MILFPPLASLCSFASKFFSLVEQYPVLSVFLVVTHSVHIETYGCAFNTSDSEVMAGLLERAGFTLVADASAADVVVVNSCTVKDRTVLDLRRRMAALGAGGRRPAVVLAGCVPRVPGQAREFLSVSQMGPDNVGQIAEVVRRTLAGERVKMTHREHAPRLLLPKRRKNPAIEIIPISKGCLGDCTFCQTVLARGRLHSFEEDDILAAVEAAVADGVAMMWLTSQDCGAYGVDRNTNLPQLLRRVARVPGDFLVRVGMANPDLVKPWADELAEALAHHKFFQFAHIPVQAGSDAVLAAMGREYAAQDFRGIAQTLRGRLPEVTLATDIIVGFPTESDADFAQTLRLLDETAVPVVNRSRYSARPGTRAARLAGLESRVISARSKQLAARAAAINRQALAPLVGRAVWAIAEDTPRPGVTMFRTRQYVPVVVEEPHAPGNRATVEITGVEGFHAVGRTVGAANEMDEGRRRDDG